MKTEAKLFKRCYLGDNSVDTKLNDFLSSRPNYEIAHINYSCPPGTCLENLIVVFNIKDEVESK